MSLEPQQEWYFDSSRWYFKVLRLFNLLEPDRTVISLSKILIWMTLLGFVYVMLTSPENMLAVLASLGSVIGSLGNYMHRRM